MDNMSLVKKLPPMLSGSELEQALTILPEYDPAIANENEAMRLIALTDIYKVNVGSGLLSFACIADILNANIGLSVLGSNDLDMLSKIYLRLQIISGSSIYGLLPCRLHRLNSNQGFAVKSAFNQRKGNILPIFQQPDFCYILWVIGNGYFAPR